MTLTIAPVRDRRALSRFIDLPWQIYEPARYPEWVPPLRVMVRDAVDEKRNAFYKRARRELFLAMRNGRVVGRIAAIENRAHNQYYDDRVGFFGFFECFDDQDAANALLDAAREWLRSAGLEVMRGPMSPSTNHECGLLVAGFDEHPTFMTPWNPPYYADLLERGGLAAVKDLLAYHLPLGPSGLRLDQRYAEHAQRLANDARLVFRDIDLRNFKKELEIAWDIYNSAWEKNWGFVPMTRDEFVYMASEMKPLIRPDWGVIAEIDGKPAGLMLAIPDVNIVLKRVRSGRLFPTGLLRLLFGAKKVRSGRVMLLGVKPEYRTRSIFAMIMHETWRRADATGARAAEASWILENNEAMRRPLEKLGGRVYRRWRIYEQPVTRSA